MEGDVWAESSIPTNERIVSQSTKYFDDGSYLNIIVTEQPFVTRSQSTYSKTGAKDLFTKTRP